MLGVAAPPMRAIGVGAVAAIASENEFVGALSSKAAAPTSQRGEAEASGTLSTEEQAHLSACAQAAREGAVAGVIAVAGLRSLS